MEISSKPYEDLKNNPVALLALVNKYVKVNLIKSKTFSGFVLSIDPIYYSIILSEPEKESYHTYILPGHAIESIEECPTEKFKPPLRKSEMGNVDVTRKKEQIISWLRKHLLNVDVDDEDILLDGVRILPPYESIDIQTSNQNVFIQVKRLLDKIPENFEP